MGLVSWKANNGVFCAFVVLRYCLGVLITDSFLTFGKIGNRLTSYYLLITKATRTGMLRLGDEKLVTFHPDITVFYSSLFERLIQYPYQTS